jgi:plastocyanin
MDQKLGLGVIVMITLVSTTIAGILVLTSGSGILLLNNSSINQVQAQQQQQQDDNTIRVAAGGGNATSLLAAFVPQNIEVKTGQSINWYNPTPVAEPHSVTFLKDHRLFPPFAAPFAVQIQLNSNL